MAIPPRKPGSQVPPNRRPLFTDRRTASTHSKVPVDQATAGKLYRVRDRHYEGEPGRVWGEELSWADANRLKEQVVGSRRSTTARVEDMEVAMPDGPADVGTAAAPILGRPLGGAGRLAYEMVDSEPQLAPHDGAVMRVPEGHELLVNDAPVPYVPYAVSAGDMLQARPMDPDLALARSSALAAVRPVVAAAAARARYRDVTAKPTKSPKAPAPRDKTVSKDPPFVRLGAPLAAPPQPPPSPLKVATQTDGEALPDEGLSEADLHDLDIGGGPSDDDIDHARRQRDQTGSP